MCSLKTEGTGEFSLERTCKNTTSKGNTVLQSKDIYVGIGNSLREDITHSTKLACISKTTRCNLKRFGVACMSKFVASKEKAQESFLSKEYVRIPLHKEIQFCRVKTYTYVLETLYEKK